MGQDLSQLNIADSFQYLTQISGSTLTDGTGSVITDLDINAATATLADEATIADNAVTAGLATSASQAENAVTADSATSASYATQAGGLDTGIDINVNAVSASFGYFTSASVGYLESITGSAKIIGDAFVIVNSNLPAEKYAGLSVYDSGSAETTASFYFDGALNDWNYEYTNGFTEYAVAMFGPEYSTKGVPVYPSNNTLLKGNGGHHVEDSNITDDGTLVTINSEVTTTGAVTASAFVGDGSQLTGIFPYTGSVSLDVNALSIASTTASMDLSTGNFFTLGLAAGANTLLEATNIEPGQTINLKVTNAATPGTLTFGSAFQFTDGTPFEVTAEASAVDVLTFISFDGTSLQATGLKKFS